MRDKKKIRRYIEKQIEAGYSRENIEKSLLKAGWSQQSIDNAFSFLNKKNTTSRDSKNNKKLILSSIFGLLILSLLIFGGFYMLTRNKENKQEANDSEVVEQEEEVKNGDSEVEKEEQLTLSDADNCQPGEFEVEFELKDGEMPIPLKGEMSFLGLKGDYCQISYSLDIPEEDKNEIEDLFKKEMGIEDLDYAFHPQYTGDQNFCFMPEEDFESFHEELQSGTITKDPFFDCIEESIQTEEQFRSFSEVISKQKEGDYNGEFEWDITTAFFLKHSFTEKISLEGSSNSGQCFFKSEVDNVNILEDVSPKEVESADLVQHQPGYCITPCQGIIETLLSKRSSKQLNFSTLSNPEELDYSETIEREDGTAEVIRYVTTMTNGLPCVYASDELINKDPNINSEEEIFEALLNHPKVNN